jgi:hypothetical protein
VGTLLIAGAAISDAAVQLNPKGQRQNISELKTDAEGNFSFDRLSAGEYELRVEYIGFWDAWQPFKLARPKNNSKCDKPIRVVMKLAGNCSYVENGWKKGK